MAPAVTSLALLRPSGHCGGERDPHSRVPTNVASLRPFSLGSFEGLRPPRAPMRRWAVGPSPCTSAGRGVNSAAGAWPLVSIQAVIALCFLAASVLFGVSCSRLCFPDGTPSHTDQLGTWPFFPATFFLEVLVSPLIAFSLPCKIRWMEL